MQQAVHSTQNVSQLIKLDCKRVEPDSHMQKLTNFTVSKTDVTKFLWGRLGGVAPTTFWPWGRSPPWSRRLWWLRYHQDRTAAKDAIPNPNPIPNPNGVNALL